MSTYPIDQTVLAARATGVVESVTEWDRDPMGKAVRTDRPMLDRETGAPLWEVEVTYMATEFGRLVTQISRVQVPAPAMPVLPAFDPVTFDGLALNINDKTGRQSLRARAIVGAARAKGEAA